MDYKTLLVRVEDRVAVITLNRPRSLNALNSELIEELNRALAAVEGDTAVGAVIITGQEKYFAVGADIPEISGLDSPLAAQAFVTRVNQVLNRLESLPKPVIAAVSGLALGGGCELAMCCDLRIAAEGARFGQPEIKIGVIPGAGGTQRLPRLVGLGRAKEMLFLGNPIEAAEALRIGLVNRVVPFASLLDEARKIALEMLKLPPLALRMTKWVVNEGINTDLRTALGLEARCFEFLFSTADQKEGMKAFLEKRKPEFRGK
jgi:enoyl-CoA hydratase